MDRILKKFPARSSAVRTPKDKRRQVTRWSSNESCTLSQIVGEIVVHSYIKIPMHQLNWESVLMQVVTEFGVKLKMFVALVCGLHRQSCDLLLHGHVGVEKSWGRVSLSQYQHLQQQVFWGFHSLDGSNDSWDLMSRGTNKSNSWQVYDLQRSLQPALTSDKHTHIHLVHVFMYSMSQDSWTILLGKNQKGIGIYEFYFGILTIARTSSFFFTKRLMPIKHLPDFAESLGPQQQPYSGKVWDFPRSFCSIKTSQKGQGELIKAKEYHTTHYYYSIETSNIIM